MTCRHHVSAPCGVCQMERAEEMNSDMVTARTLAKALRVAWCPGSSAIEQDYEMIAAALRAALEAAGYEFDKSTGGEGIVIISRMIRAAYGERGDAE